MQSASKVKPFETVVLSVVKTPSLSWHRRCHPPLCASVFSIFSSRVVELPSFFLLVVQVSCNVYRPKEGLRRWIVYIIVNGFLWLKQKIILLCNPKLIGQNLGRMHRRFTRREESFIMSAFIPPQATPRRSTVTTTIRESKRGPEKRCPMPIGLEKYCNAADQRVLRALGLLEAEGSLTAIERRARLLEN